MMTYILVGALGLVVGFLAGVVFDDALDLYRASRKERPMPTRSHTLNRWLLVIVLAINSLLAGFLIVQRAHTAEFTSCTAEWQSDFLAAYEVRSDAASDVQHALDALLDAVDDEDRARFAEALSSYQELRRNQIATRRATPLPPLPERVCGEVAQ